MAKIVLEPNNKRHFTDVIQKAVSQYQAEIVAKIEREFEILQIGMFQKILNIQTFTLKRNIKNA